MGGAMYFEVMVPKQIRSPYPDRVPPRRRADRRRLAADAGRPAGLGLQLPRHGLRRLPARIFRRAGDRSTCRASTAPTRTSISTSAPRTNLEEIFTASAARGDFPQAKKHTQWPGTGRIGDKIFDDFNKTQVQFLAGAAPGDDDARRQRRAARHDRHAGHPADALAGRRRSGGRSPIARPNLVKAIVTLEPAAPPIKGVDTAKVAYNDGGGLAWGVSRQPGHLRAGSEQLRPSCRRSSRRQRRSPARSPVTCSRSRRASSRTSQNIPVLFLSGEGGYHRVFDRCVATWLNQAGVKTEYVEMEKVGLRGQRPQMMLEKNSADIAKYMGAWLAKNAPAGRPRRVEGDAAEDDPDVRDRLHRAQRLLLRRRLVLWVSRASRSCTARCTRKCWVPKQIKSPNPMVIFHGNGQTGAGLALDARRPQGMGVLSDGRGLRRLHGRLPGARPLGLRAAEDRPTARCRSTATSASAPGSSSSASGPTARERGDFPLKNEPHAVAGDGQDRAIRSSTPSSGRRCSSPRREHATGARRRRRAARHDRHAGHPVHALAGRRRRLRGDGSSVRSWCTRW